MIAAYSTQDQKKLQIVAGWMRDAFGVNRDSKFAGIIELDGLPTASYLKNLRDVMPEQASDRTTPPARDMTLEDGLSVGGYPEAFGSGDFAAAGDAGHAVSRGALEEHRRRAIAARPRRLTRR